MTTATRERAGTSYASLGATRSAAATRAKAIAPWLAILVLGALALVAVGMRGAPEARFLDPRSSAPVGSKALAEVLRQQGVEVSVVTALAELPSKIPDDTTVVVTADERLSPTAVSALVARARSADRLVALLSQPQVVNQLAPDLQGFAVPQMLEGRSAPASRCEISGVRAGDVVVGGTVSLLGTGGGSAEVCLPVSDSGSGAALLGRLPADEVRAETLLVGFAAGLTNDAITTEDNAAVALRLLGQSPQVLWLIPSGADGPEGASGDSFSPWPAWVTPVMWVLALGTVLLALVRGRRLGRLATEPLPVVVRAAETTESRGHLYRRSRDRARTAAILRQGTRRRLQRRLGVDRSAPPDTLITAVASATGEPPERIHDLLADAEPASTSELVRLGTDLADLERKVRLT